MSNFQFLKKQNESLFKIVVEAENLFRDEYFEQATVQIRKFAENLCKDLLQDKVSQEDTFDSIINKIKDKSFNNIRMNEFAQDLYFLKKHGNVSAHSASSGKFVSEGKIALECLERAFEISIFYSMSKFGYDKKLDKMVFSEELLMTGKKTSQKVLKEKYSTELKKARVQKTKEKPKSIKNNKVTKQKKNIKLSGKKKSKDSSIVGVLIAAAILFIFLVLKFYTFSL